MTAAILTPGLDAPARERRRVGMRWKLLLAFGLCFTAVFVVVAIWIVRFTTDTASTRLRSTLQGISAGAADTIDIDNFLALVNDVQPPTPGEVYPDNAGTLAGTVATADSEWPTDPRYWDHVNELVRIRSLDQQASPYTYTVDADGTMRFVGSWGATGYPVAGTDPPDGVRLLQSVDEVVPAETIGYFTDGLEATTEQPAYTDDYGTWISAYTPLFDKAGTVVGAIGVDYEASYVNDVRQRSIRVLYPVLGLSYAALIVLVIVLSGGLTRRLGRLSAVTQRVAAGDYDVDVSSAAHSRWSDEMTELADSFRVMTEKVGTRERTLVQEVAVLKVEIDQARRERSVAEITDTDFFSNLSAKAALMRAKVKAHDDDE
ncbi:MAG: HAMP domain-containing protein [Ilumatobacteraceae bacterium]